jgi:hypothetical protein
MQDSRNTESADRFRCLKLDLITITVVGEAQNMWANLTVIFVREIEVRKLILLENNTERMFENLFLIVEFLTRVSLTSNDWTVG